MISWKDVEKAQEIMKIEKERKRAMEVPFLEAEAKAREQNIPEMQRLKHLAHWGLKFEKYASFSKDPEFKKRCMQRRSMCFNMMDSKGR